VPGHHDLAGAADPASAGHQRVLLADLVALELIRPGGTTATYHVHQLAVAGLVSCERRGSSVVVSRTARGNELVDLLAD